MTLVGRTFDGLNERYLDWDELSVLADSGVVTIGSHAHMHRSLGLLPIEEARIEAARFREVLQDRLGREIVSSAYPFGTRTDCHEATEKAQEDAGYAVAFSSMHGAIRTGMAPMSLPRVKVEGGESLTMFSRITPGDLDA